MKSLKKVCFLFILILIINYSSSLRNKFSQNKCLTKDESNKCINCEKGYYLHNMNCIEICPLNTYADIISKNCTERISGISYTKSFTMTNCINKCGIEFPECSCTKDCWRRGNCCSDIDNCLSILNDINSSKNKTTLVNCEYDSDDGKLCLQCKLGYYLYKSKNQCLSQCPNTTNIDSINNICLEKKENNLLNVANKTEIVNNSTRINSTFIACNSNLFDFNNTLCLEECPESFIADRRNKTCVSTNRHDLGPFYYVFLAKHHVRVIVD